MTVFLVVKEYFAAPHFYMRCLGVFDNADLAEQVASQHEGAWVFKTGMNEETQV